MAVSKTSIIDTINENNIDQLNICTTLEKPTTPNKQVIDCLNFYEGQYLIVVKKTSKGFISLNEVVPNVLGNSDLKSGINFLKIEFSISGKPFPMASSFVYEIETSTKYEPKYAFDGLIGKTGFKTIHERYPWFAIDFEQPRIIESVNITVPESVRQ